MAKPKTKAKKKIKYHWIEHDYYKYQLDTAYSVSIGITGNSVDTGFITLNQNGKLEIKKGYCWDGPSGPAPDWESLMRASLVHDALYQLMREEQIGQGWRKLADQLFRDMCMEDGLNEFAAEVAYWAVRTFAEFAALPESDINAAFV